MSTHPAEQTAIDAFSTRLLTMLNHGALALMISLGHRTRLFDVMAELPPATSAQIAEAAGLNERYVREWLSALVVGEVIEFDEATGKYCLPRAHAAALTRTAAPNNLAVFMQYIPLLGSVEDGILHAFQNGGGVPYADFKRFHDVMAEDSGQSVLPALIDQILPLAPGVVERLAQGITVLDLGCGRGKALMLLAATYPQSRFVGYDFSPEAMALATGEARAQGLSNLTFQVQDAALLDERERYDLVLTFDAIHDQAKPDVVLANIRKALKTDGVYLMQDIDGSSHLPGNLNHPLGPLLYTISTMHCMTVSLAYGGCGLGTMWGRETALAMLAEAGFTQTEVYTLAHDIQNCYYVSRKA